MPCYVTRKWLVVFLSNWKSLTWFLLSLLPPTFQDVSSTQYSHFVYIEWIISTLDNKSETIYWLFLSFLTLFTEKSSGSTSRHFLRLRPRFHRYLGTTCFQMAYLVRASIYPLYSLIIELRAGQAEPLFRYYDSLLRVPLLLKVAAERPYIVLTSDMPSMTMFHINI